MSESSSQIYDVIVVGGGLSGLSAATKLKEKSSPLNVVVLEASDRVGGRTESIDIKGPKGNDDTLDLGGHWISTLQTYIMDMAKDLGVEYYPQNIKGTKIMEVGDNKVRTYTSEIPSLGSWKALIDVQRIITTAENLIKEIDIRDPYAHPKAREMDEMTVAAYLNGMTSHKSVQDMLNAAFIACYGCDTSQISLLFALAYANSGGGLMNLLLVENGAAQEFRIKGGAQQFTVKLVEKFGRDNVLTGKAVCFVEKNVDGTGVVSCRDGSSYKAKRIICTTIANQTAKIEFQPPMPVGRQSLLKNFFVGNLMKFYILYEESFWIEDGFSGEVVSSGGPSESRACENGPVSIIYDATTKSGTPALVAFSAGRNADQWFSKSASERKSAVVAQLVRYFGPKAKKPAQFFEKNWMEEPFVAGAPVSILPPGQMHNFHYLRQPHSDLVHFAGTETATHWCGYLSGAVQSGYRAAIEVLKELDPEKIGAEDEAILKDELPLTKGRYRDVKRSKLTTGFGCSVM